MNIPTVTIEFDITRAEKTIAWFYSGKKQDKYEQGKGRLSLFNVIPNGIEAHRSAVNMLFKCRGHLAKVTLFSSLGASSLRIDDEYGWRP